MGYLFLLDELSWQSSAVPNSRQGYSGCRISNFPDGGRECLHDKRLRGRRVGSERCYTTGSLAVSPGSGESVSPPNVLTCKAFRGTFAERPTCLCDSRSVV